MSSANQPWSRKRRTVAPTVDSKPARSCLDCHWVIASACAGKGDASRMAATSSGRPGTRLIRAPRLFTRSNSGPPCSNRAQFRATSRSQGAEARTSSSVRCSPKRCSLRRPRALGSVVSHVAPQAGSLAKMRSTSAPRNRDVRSDRSAASNASRRMRPTAGVCSRRHTRRGHSANALSIIERTGSCSFLRDSTRDRAWGQQQFEQHQGRVGDLVGDERQV